MAGPSCNFRRLLWRGLLRAAVLVGLVPLLVSCLDLSVEVEFRTSTAGQIRVDAVARRLAQGLQTAEGSDLVVVPSTRAGWQALVDAVPGASLISWQGVDEDLGLHTKAVFGFANARALEGLFIVFKQKLTLLQDGQGKWTLTFAPTLPRLTGGDAESRCLWTALWGPVAWSFGFSPPSQPRSVRTVTLAELAAAQPPPEWTLTW